MIRSPFRTVTLGVALFLIVAGVVLSGPAALRPDSRSAEASLFNEIKKLTGSGI